MFNFEPILEIIHDDGLRASRYQPALSSLPYEKLWEDTQDLDEQVWEFNIRSQMDTMQPSIKFFQHWTPWSIQSTS